MQWTVDLHGHSGYSGGVGTIQLESIARTMIEKGIHLYGTGDALHPAWSRQLMDSLTETEPGLFQLKTRPGPRFLLQSELVLTAPLIAGARARKSVHIILLLPSFDAIRKVQQLLTLYQVRNTIGRPFVQLKGPEDVSRFLDHLLDEDPGILTIPAHIMTPDGIYGSRNPVNHMSAFFGDSASRIQVVETGLSADPDMLSHIPELAQVRFLSNSDAHSAARHRVGRECTVIRFERADYHGVIDAITGDGIVETIEFHPKEGKYFGTGHRKGRSGHLQDSYFSMDDHPPETCPSCGKKLVPGVHARIHQVSAAQKTSLKEPAPLSRSFRHLVPLTEVIAFGLGSASPSGKHVQRLYEQLIAAAGNELDVWKLSETELGLLLDEPPGIPPRVRRAIQQVHSGSFSFDPPGFDGEYGRLNLVLNTDPSTQVGQ